MLTLKLNLKNIKCIEIEKTICAGQNLTFKLFEVVHFVAYNANVIKTEFWNCINSNLHLAIKYFIVLMSTHDERRRPASADRTPRRQFQAVFPVITDSFPNNVIAHLHGLSMDQTVERTVSPNVNSTVGWTVGLTVELCKKFKYSYSVLNDSCTCMGRYYQSSWFWSFT